jgi:hypothetical protein
MPKKEEQPKAIEPEQVAPGAAASGDEPVIQTIPEKFYGAALKARLTMSGEGEEKKGADKKKAAPSSGEPKKGMGVGVIIIILVVLLAGAGAGFVYFNQELLFGAPADEAPEPPPEPPKPPLPPPPPSAPTNLSATATNPSVVQINWTDASNNEAGFRVERREPATEYKSVMSLPPNSSAFQDRTVQAEKSYLYRVIALNEGGESPASNEATVDTPPEPPPPPEQPKLPPAGLDSDSDGLTDLEEPLYGTSPRDPDADKDSFLDGNEVFHLYNPAGGASVRLLESGLVKPFESSVGWKIFVPTTWKIEMSGDGMEGTVITGHGETFTVTMEPNPQEEDLLDWYLKRNPGTLSSQVVAITTKSGFDGLEGADLLTTYFLWDNMVLVFKYNLNDQTFVNFRLTYEMMKNSLFLSLKPTLPESYVVPAEIIPEIIQEPMEESSEEPPPEEPPLEELPPEDELPPET